MWSRAHFGRRLMAFGEIARSFPRRTTIVTLLNYTFARRTAFDRAFQEILRKNQ